MGGQDAHVMCKQRIQDRGSRITLASAKIRNGPKLMVMMGLQRCRHRLFPKTQLLQKDESLMDKYPG
jgi:hypothetical protein